MNAQAVDKVSLYPQIRDFCERHYINKLRLFGSVLRPDFHSDSDIDVLVEFDPEHIPGYFGLVAMQDELSTLFGRTIDLNTPQSLSRHFRQKALQAARTIYERAG